MGKLAHEGALLTAYYAVTHPSQPNYIALMGGDTLGVDSNKNVTLDDVNLADRLELAKRTWKVYAEGYPGGCYLKAKTGKYARKHVPALSFKDITEDPARCARVIGGDQLAADVNSGGTNRVYASLYGPSIMPGTVSVNRYDHYSLVRLVEDNFGLMSLGRKDATAQPIDGVWKTAK